MISTSSYIGILLSEISRPSFGVISASIARRVSADYELLALATQKGNELEEAEKVLAELNAKALSLVGVRFGVDSSQYQSVGGTRRSDRKRRRPAVG